MAHTKYIVHAIDPTEGESESEPVELWEAVQHTIDLMDEAAEREIPVNRFRPENPLSDILYIWIEEAAR